MFTVVNFIIYFIFYSTVSHLPARKPFKQTTSTKFPMTATTFPSTATETTKRSTTPTTITGTSTTAIAAANTSATKTPSTSTVTQRRVIFSKEIDIFLCREILGTGLLCKKKQSAGRVHNWEDISSKLKNRFLTNFSVRSCRDRYNLLAEKCKKRNAEGLRESGIAPAYSELDNLLQNLFDIEKAAKDNKIKISENGQNTNEKTIRTRKRISESIGETQEREKGKKETRSNNHIYLEKWKSHELVIREKEVEIREREAELREKEIGLRERENELREQELASSGKIVSSLQEMVTLQKEFTKKFFD